MKKVQSIQRFLLLMLAAALLAPLSAIAEDRPDWRTGSVVEVQARRGGADLTGTVVGVRSNGDGFVLRTRGRDVYVEAKGGVRAYYRGRAYRIRDLERGDRVAVDLRSTSSRVLKARSVEVLQSVSDGRYRRDGRYDDRYGRNDRYGRDPYGRNDGYGQHRGNELLRGQIVRVDHRRYTMIVRTDGRRDVEVDTRPLMDQRGADRSLRTGDYVELRGMFHGRIFVADAVSRSDRYGRY
jgi:hypothetical protein